MPAQAERPRRPRSIAAGARERVADQLDLELAGAAPDALGPLPHHRRLGNGEPFAERVGRHGAGRTEGVDRALERRLQLADIPGPRVPGQELERVPRDPLCLGTIAAVEAPEGVRDEQGHVVPPLPERRRADREHVQAVEEVGPEPAGADFGGEIPVRRGHDAHVHAADAALPDATQLALLKRAEEPALHGGARVADLVQEERPAVRELEESGTVGVRAGERALRVAEELALDQGIGDRREVVRDERPRGARSLAVERPRDELLPRPRLPVDEHGGRARRQGRDPRPQLEDRAAPPDEPERPRVRTVPFGGEILDFERPAAVPRRCRRIGLPSHIHLPIPRILCEPNLP